jgi:hypothetical protein
MEAAAIEAAEARAWADMYAAAPPEYARAAGVRTREVAGALVLSWAATGRRYFSRAIGLGVAAPATPEALDRILDGWAEEGISAFLLQSLPDCAPAGYRTARRPATRAGCASAGCGRSTSRSGSCAAASRSGRSRRPSASSWSSA